MNQVSYRSHFDTLVNILILYLNIFVISYHETVTVILLLAVNYFRKKAAS